ncbi:phage head morphogenesis protein [haloarchaeon 3A1-DGR]|nr:phage head morphogenesis protein [haloarchaeon 3A1-DGR]
MASEDPTRTKTIRRTYEQRLRGGFGRINSTIREAVIKDDVFGLREPETSDGVEVFAADDVDPPPDLRTLSEAEQVERFEEWLAEAQESEVLEVIERDENRFVRRAYERGLEDADTNLRKAGVDVPGTDVESLMRRPVHEERLQLIFSRNFAELDGITNAVSQQVSRELADGIAQGQSPSAIARRITDRVNKIGKTRASALARDQVVSTHAEATLQRYKEQDVEEVGIDPEVRVSTAGDTLVCDRCQAAADGSPYTIEELEQNSHLRPAIHPNCRCAVVPVANTEAAAAYRAHPTAFRELHAVGAFRRGVTYEALAGADRDGAAELVATHTGAVLA